ncbi:50S ribosomal protein L25 [Jeotgalibaca caeni]|uniref:50S ribosomal protein L25 n=1 Tax=Jeotgalibaca caeni TaxID=3028623 RepID=UPI00237DC9F5|nr:50S ribosomal protein L25 [Jeotgalibaca caeni]MDE1548663.1 50S ribosomal protein L25 [Jeotgalibaca caeni]
MKLTAQKRERVGSSASKKARVENKVPAVIYGKEFDATSVLVDRKQFEELLRELGRNAVFNVDVDGKETQVMIKNIDHSHIKPELYNVELQALKEGQTVTVEVTINLVGAENIKEGVFTQTLNELEIETVATDIPQEITVELGEMAIGDTLTVGELKVPAGVTVLTDAETTVAVVSAPSVEEETTDEAAEPEVIGEENE